MVHPVGIFFRRSVTSEFEYQVIASGADLQPPAPGRDADIGTGPIRFDTDGALLSVDSTSGAEVLIVIFEALTECQAIELDFGAPKSAGGDGRLGFTHYALLNQISFQSKVTW